MQTIKALIMNAFTGIVIGSTVFLGTIIFGLTTTMPTPMTALGIVIMSALIGVLNDIVTSNRLPYPVLIGIHFISTMLIVIAADFLLHWGWLEHTSLVAFIVTFTIIYGLVWLGVYLHSWLTTRRLNQRLRERSRK
ncbi:DUF3021 domain-containing protein [Lacticaseibacillus saniviri]